MEHLLRLQATVIANAGITMESDILYFIYR